MGTERETMYALQWRFCVPAGSDMSLGSTCSCGIVICLHAIEYGHHCSRSVSPFNLQEQPSSHQPSVLRIAEMISVSRRPHF